MNILYICKTSMSDIMVRVRFLWFIIWGCGQLLAQEVEQDQLMGVLVDEYMQVVEGKSILYYGNGQDSYPRAISHPYFESAEYVETRLSYNQVIYPKALLRLDLNRDELVILSPEGRNIVLFPENVDFAELYSRNLIFFRSDSMPGCPSTGYYFVLHSGNCVVMEKQSCTMSGKSDMSFEVEYIFKQSINYYLYKDGVYYKIKNKRTLLKALHPYKEEINRFISANQLLFKRNAAEFLTRAVSEYEELSGLL